jgi:hypothetical protein
MVIPVSFVREKLGDVVYIATAALQSVGGARVVDTYQKGLLAGRHYWR